MSTHHSRFGPDCGVAFTKTTMRALVTFNDAGGATSH
jgi:hypothetical protein